MVMSRCPAFCGPTAEQSVPTPLLPLFIGLEGEGPFMQMTGLPSIPHNALITSGTWVSFLCLRVRVARGGASLLSSHGRGMAPQDALKKDSRGLCRGAASSTMKSLTIPHRM